MSNLLKDASILLTPTGYDNGSMNATKPTGGDGDFTFVRGSAATRVNAQGLVENVQIIGGELVTNGNFSQIGSQKVTNGNFSQEGSELVINGDFATDSDWVLGTGVSIADGKLTKTNPSVGNTSAFQTSVFTIGKTYKYTLALSGNITASDKVVVFGTDFTSSGTYEGYYTSPVTSLVFSLRGSTNTYSIDNVSVKEVGQDWGLGTGWSIGDGKAVCIGDSNHTRLTQNESFVSGKTYKVTFDIVVDSGNFKIQLLGGGSDSGNTITSTQIQYTEYIVATSNRSSFGIRSNDGNGIGSITNISVKEVGQGWTVFNGNITDKYNASMTAYQSGIRVTPFNKTGKFKVLFDLVITSGNMKFDAGGVNNQTYTTSGTKEIIIINPTKFEFNAFNLGWVGTLDNVSVKEVTDDTNIPRINYEGFSYQDSLGSELVTNGDFATDSYWDKRGSETTISDGKCNFNWVGNNYILLQYNVIEVGKTYKLTYEILSYTSGKIYANVGGNLNFREAVGVYTEHFTAAGTNLAFRSNSGFIGSIDNVSVKEVTGQEVVPDSGCGSWLLEPQSTNLVPYSEDFSQWVGVNSVIVALTTETSAPNGLLSSVYKITSGNVSSRIQVSSITSASNYTKSIFVKHSTNTTLRFDGSGSNNRVEFSITSSGVTLSSAASNVISTNIEDYGNGWFRISATLPAASDFFQINPDVSGNDNGSVYIWGAQLENQSFATSYIPTEGATNTRNQDIATNSGNATLINSTEGTLYAEIATLADGVNGRYISIGDGSLSNYVYIRITGNLNEIKMGIVKGGSTQASKSFTVPNLKQSNKLAVSYQQDLFRFYVNGTLIFTDTNGDIFPIGTLNALTFNLANTNNYFNGKNKCVAVYKEAPTDAELQCLTTI